jgi:hypothetical protein
MARPVGPFWSERSYRGPGLMLDYFSLTPEPLIAEPFHCDDLPDTEALDRAFELRQQRTIANLRARPKKRAGR